MSKQYELSTIAKDYNVSLSERTVLALNNLGINYTDSAVKHIIPLVATAEIEHSMSASRCYHLAMLKDNEVWKDSNVKSFSAFGEMFLNIDKRRLSEFCRVGERFTKCEDGFCYYSLTDNDFENFSFGTMRRLLPFTDEQIAEMIDRKLIKGKLTDSLNYKGIQFYAEMLNGQNPKTEETATEETTTATEETATEETATEETATEETASEETATEETTGAEVIKLLETANEKMTKAEILAIIQSAIEMLK